MLTYRLPLKWKKTSEMPSGVSSAQAVLTGGKVYIGGGGAEGGDYKVLVYTIQGGQWEEEIETPVHYFGLAVVNDQLIIAGGQDKEHCPTNKVWVLESASRSWTQPFPAMPTGRSSPSALGYKRWLLVVGGGDKKCVEILDTASKLWYNATPLPSDALRPSLTVIQDTLYAVWKSSFVSIFIPVLISDAMSQIVGSDTPNHPKPTKWLQLPDTPTRRPTITAFCGTLLALGGTPASSTIAMYLPHTEQWLQVAEFPIPYRYCACALVPETGELMVIGGGGEDGQSIKYICSCTL